MNQYPKLLMKNVLWSFSEHYDSMSQFSKAVNDYSEKVLNEPFSFDETKPVLNTKKVTIQYMYWDDDEEDILEPDFELTADNKLSFSECELLYKVNNKVINKLKFADNHFFEGFQLFEGENPNSPNIPLYFLLQGS